MIQFINGKNKPTTKLKKETGLRKINLQNRDGSYLFSNAL